MVKAQIESGLKANSPTPPVDRSLRRETVKQLKGVRFKLESDDKNGPTEETEACTLINGQGPDLDTAAEICGKTVLQDLVGNIPYCRNIFQMPLGSTRSIILTSHDSHINSRLIFQRKKHVIEDSSGAKRKESQLALSRDHGCQASTITPVGLSPERRLFAPCQVPTVLARTSLITFDRSGNFALSTRVTPSLNATLPRQRTTFTPFQTCVYRGRTDLGFELAGNMITHIDDSGPVGKNRNLRYYAVRATYVCIY